MSNPPHPLISACNNIWQRVQIITFFILVLPHPHLDPNSLFKILQKLIVVNKAYKIEQTFLSVLVVKSFILSPYRYSSVRRKCALQ
jgi:hypothetical protein